ncbi:hypothetical protein CAPTEDRAFT_193810 [Capitella teleta]|uniref:G-protein coupled receptors family 1 profile domain-containing protein n=1 Tax=Capitella teleta TaxID=283909 RepID=R7TDF1_CAPTE|nr:hypothetical protein CAPTEDRAFT_193810 [Capitella teleta]|eukprot:ELT89091.1 hypothetical protein CAPTEDRAFT_193810 [Capitella teleta]
MKITDMGRVATTEALSTLDPPLSTHMSKVQLGIISATLAASVITTIINPLTLLALFKQKMITKSSINLFIASLCCSDFLYGFSAGVFQLYKLLQLGPTSEHVLTCVNLTGGILCVLAYLVSYTNALLVSVDRAYATLAPFKYKTQLSIKRASVILALALMVAVLQALIPITINMASADIVIVEYSFELLPTSYRLYWANPLLFIGLAVNILLYTVIVVAFLKTQKLVQPSSSSSELRNRRMTRTVTMVIGSLLIGNIPIVTVAAFPPSLDGLYLWSYAMCYDMAMFCTIIPTFLNNFLYVWQLPDFNRAVRQLLTCHSNTIANLVSDT